MVFEYLDFFVFFFDDFDQLVIFIKKCFHLRSKIRLLFMVIMSINILITKISSSKKFIIGRRWLDGVVHLRLSDRCNDFGFLEYHNNDYIIGYEY